MVPIRSSRRVRAACAWAPSRIAYGGYACEVRRQRSDGVVTSGPRPGRAVQTVRWPRPPPPDRSLEGARRGPLRPRAVQVGARDYVLAFSDGPREANASRAAVPWLMAVSAGESATTCWENDGTGCDVWLVEVYADGTTGAVERLPYGATEGNGPALTPRLDRGGERLLFMQREDADRQITLYDRGSGTDEFVVGPGTFATNPSWLNETEVLYNQDNADTMWLAHRDLRPWAHDYLGGPAEDFGAGCTLADPSAEAGGRFVALHSSVRSCAASDCSCPWIEVQDNEYPVDKDDRGTFRLVPVKLALRALPLSTPAGSWAGNYLPFTLPDPLELSEHKKDDEAQAFGAGHVATSRRSGHVIAYRQDAGGSGPFGYKKWRGVYHWNSRGTRLVTDVVNRLELEMFQHEEFDENPAADLLDGSVAQNEAIYRHKYYRWLPGDRGVLATVSVSSSVVGAKEDEVVYSRIMMVDLSSGAPVYHDLTEAIEEQVGLDVGTSPEAFGVQKGDIVPTGRP